MLQSERTESLLSACAVTSEETQRCEQILSKLASCEAALFRRQTSGVTHSDASSISARAQTLLDRLTKVESLLFQRNQQSNKSEVELLQKKPVEVETEKVDPTTEAAAVQETVVDKDSSTSTRPDKMSKLAAFLAQSSGNHTVLPASEPVAQEVVKDVAPPVEDAATEILPDVANMSLQSKSPIKEEVKSVPEVIADEAKTDAFPEETTVEPPKEPTADKSKVEQPSLQQTQGADAVVSKDLEMSYGVQGSAGPKTTTRVMAVDNECQKVFKELKLRRKHRYILYAIEGEHIKAVKLGKRSETFEDFLSSLPETECRYAVYDHEYKTKDGRSSDKLLFVSWNPRAAATTLKMLYATERPRVASFISGAFDLIASHAGDIQEFLGLDAGSDEDYDDGNDDWLDD